jgi:quercetin dioxygenase-like cupin family protein
MGDMHERESLETLRALTERLELVGNPDCSWVDYRVEAGRCQGKPVHYEPQVAVQISVSQPGTLLPCHLHDEVEILTVYEGTCDIYLGLDGAICQRLNAGDSIRIPAQTLHSFDAPDGCKVVGVTVPASPRYPHLPTE